MTVYRCPDLPRSYSSIETEAAIYDFITIALRADNGDVVLLGRRGTIHGYEDAAGVRKWISDDGGASWTGTEVANDANYDDRGVAGGIIPATGTIMLFYTRHNDAEADPYDLRILRSTDHGANFADLGTLSTGADEGFRAFGRVAELPSGKVLQSFYSRGAGYYRINIQYSDDDGLTWGTDTDIFTHAATYYTEPDVIYVDGSNDATARLLCVARNSGGVLRQFSSADGGATWDDDGDLPFSQGIDKDVAPSLFLYQGLVYLVYTDRTDDMMKYAVAIGADVIGDVTAWSQGIAIYTAQATLDQDQLYTQVVALADVALPTTTDLHVVFCDAPGTDEPDVFHSF